MEEMPKSFQEDVKHGMLATAATSPEISSSYLGLEKDLLPLRFSKSKKSRSGWRETGRLEMIVAL
jgi:hypothetical protein